MRPCIFGLQPAEGASSATNCGPPPPGGCGPPIAARLIRHNKPAVERMGLHERTCWTRKCSPPPGGGCGMRRLLYEAANSKFKIQNSGLQNRAAACEGRARAVSEWRAFAGRSCGPLRHLGAIHNSIFKIQNYKLGVQPAECTQVRLRTAGLRRPQVAARTVPAGSISLADSPWHCFGSSGR